MSADRGHLALALARPDLRKHSPQGRGMGMIRLCFVLVSTVPKRITPASMSTLSQVKSAISRERIPVS